MGVLLGNIFRGVLGRSGGCLMQIWGACRSVGRKFQPEIIYILFGIAGFVLGTP